MARSDFQLQGDGKYHGVVGVREVPVPRSNVREWCYVCARKGLDPYHRWRGCEHEEKEGQE